MQSTRRGIIRAGLAGALSGLALRPVIAVAGSLAAPVPASGANVFWVTAGTGDGFQRAYNPARAEPPRFRALCRTEAGIAEALRFARDNSMPFAIQSSGHCFEGLSQSPHLVIDLREMRGVRYTDGGGVAVAGPGATIGEMNGSAPGGVQVLPAGYCQTVALGGLVGGGGIGVLSRAFGLSCDHLRAARVVLADGRAIDASPTENADLFWALRGGGAGSFGVVSSYTLALRAVPRAALIDMVWAFPLKAAADFLERWQEICSRQRRVIASKLYFKFKPPETVYARIRLVAPDGPEGLAPARAAITAFQRPNRGLREIDGTFPEIADAIWPRLFYPVRRVESASDFLAGVVPARAWHEALQPFTIAEAWPLAVSIEHMGGAIDDPAPDDTAYVHRRGSAFLVSYTAPLDVAHDAAGDNTVRIAAMRQMQQALAVHATGGAYVNYPDRDLPGWQRAYWGDNHARLRAVKAKYDPGNVFRHALSIRP